MFVVIGASGHIGSAAEKALYGALGALLVLLPYLLIRAAGYSSTQAGNSRRTGSASGLNSAISRTGGMAATALLGGVLGTGSSALVSGFHVVALACAIASVAAAASALRTSWKVKRWSDN